MIYFKQGFLPKISASNTWVDFGITPSNSHPGHSNMSVIQKTFSFEIYNLFIKVNSMNHGINPTETLKQYYDMSFDWT